MASYDCQRCLLHVEFSTRHRPLAQCVPEGWAVVELPGPRKELAWRCATCVREVASGFPEVIGDGPKRQD